MSLSVMVVLELAVAFGALLQGSIGVGFAMILSPVMAVVAPALMPVTVLLLMLPLNAFVAWRERRHIDVPGTSWITLGRLVGAFAGLAVLVAMPAGGLRVFIGFATIITVGASLMGGHFALTRPVFLGAGLVTGITETATGVGGPPLAIVYQHQPGPALRATIAACFFIGEIVSLVLLAFTGRVHADQLTMTLWLLPALAAGLLVTRWFYGRLDGPPLRIALLIFATASGAACLL